MYLRTKFKQGKYNIATVWHGASFGIYGKNILLTKATFHKSKLLGGKIWNSSECIDNNTKKLCTQEDPMIYRPVLNLHRPHTHQVLIIRERESERNHSYVPDGDQ